METRIETLINQYRYIEAYELIENADLDSTEKSRQLDDIGQKLRQHFERYAPVPVTIKHQNNRALLDVYQLLIERDYRSAREILESGGVDTSAAKAWMKWIDQVYQQEKRIYSDPAPPEPDLLNHADTMRFMVSAFVGMIIGVMILPLGGFNLIWFVVSVFLIFFSLPISWIVIGTIRYRSFSHSDERKSFLIRFVASSCGFIALIIAAAISGSIIKNNFGSGFLIAAFYIGLFFMWLTERGVKRLLGYNRLNLKSKL